MPKIIITEFMDEAAVDDLRQDFEVVYETTLFEHRDELKQLLPGVRALIVRNRTQVDRGLLDAAADLQVVGRLGVGLDNIDLDACRERGVEVCPARGANEDSVAEYVIAMALVLLREAYTDKHAMLSGQWPRAALIGHEVAGKRLGLVGVGAIARKTVDRALALGMRVAGHDPFVDAGDIIWQTVERQEFDTLLEQSDIISLHVPLTESTRALIGAAALARMQPSAVLINAARGGIVDEQALVDALHASRLSGAALDVFESEPLTREAASRFKGAPNLILTPHIAGLTVESDARVSAMTAANVRRVLAKHR